MPRLTRYLAMATVAQLPPWSAGPRGTAEEVAEAIAAAGYRGVQAYLPDQLAAARAAGLGTAGVGKVRSAPNVARFVESWEQSGVSTLTVHLGTGFEDDGQAAELVEAYLDAARSASVELTVETHRATLTQDPGRTARLVAAYPELRFTADLSHWYTGSELPYGGFDWKLEAIGPVLARTRVIHGRIADPGCVQVAVREDDEAEHVDHFRRMWRAVFDAFLAEPDADELVFAPELLPAVVSYARTVPAPGGEGREEEVDRWQQALLLCDLAESLFAEAETQAAAGGAGAEAAAERPKLRA